MTSSRLNTTQTSFKKRVLQVVCDIKIGETLAYHEVAWLAGSPNASRAVGNIMKGNSDPLVPCHRVIRANGQIGRYNRGGEKRKRTLLEKEGAVKSPIR